VLFDVLVDVLVLVLALVPMSTRQLSKSASPSDGWVSMSKIVPPPPVGVPPFVTALSVNTLSCANKKPLNLVSSGWLATMQK
jgi:hypothetical protein